MKDIKYLSIRMDSKLHEKFRYIAEYEGRSMNSQILLLVRKCVRDYEQKVEKIKH